MEQISIFPTNDCRRIPLHSHHQGLQNCGSDTSSSMDSSSDLSTPGSPAYRHRMHASWHREPSAPKDESLGLDEDEVRFARRCTKSILHARSELMPINIKRNDRHVSYLRSTDGYCQLKPNIPHLLVAALLNNNSR
ncbi:ATPase family AAA domain-containing protein 2 [Fasciola gigantica]|uniref:ATPase family AAA domain-containing protein 2 n=1 Tax=Fasciola gigantica TaxID=46835 RepID=A0A504Z9M3_FASGI|nr:ATPase family AAA domain-containing protein 2 [Fasciola gigantica]